MSQGYLWMLIICGTIQAVFLVILIVYLWMVFATRRWLPTAGTVVTSRVVAGRMSQANSAPETVHTPLVEYEYKVEGQTFRGDRIMIGGGKSEVELEGVLDRYPLGAEVIVYYNPADPQQAVLERGISAWRGFGCAFLFLWPFGVPLLAIWIYNLVAAQLIALAVAEPYAFGFGCLAFLILLYAVVLTGKAARASFWPITRGQVISSRQEKIYTEEGSFRKPSILYAYEVNGRKYTGGRVTMNVGMSSRITFLSKATLARYPVGTEVDVHYNPRSPMKSVLHPWSAGHVVPWLLAAALFALAWKLADI